ncbi:MAG: alanine--glyoxylate aminotransferase family protein [Candidatus Polarisedimenticolaceae bacterium]|nr:alanine--glyoxylate aminotransferase family protein [Candidatus Polarisedimenticolaceae bacterium]
MNSIDAKAARIKPFSSTPRTLMGPGPSELHPRVLTAMAQPTIGHLDPLFIDLMDEIKVLLQYAFQTENAVTFPLSAPGSAGMEACFANLVEPGDQVVVCQNGLFGGRMKENVERCGGIPIMVEDEWGSAVDPEKVEAVLNTHPEAKILAFVHAETSTGVESDARTLADLAIRHGCLTLVDTVTSLGGSPVLVDEWELDAVYSGSQKCLSCAPGLSPITFSARALEKVKNRRSKVQSWFMDLNLMMGYWGKGRRRVYHHTAPVNALFGLHEALLMLKEEGLENAWDRHLRHHLVLRDGLASLGIEFLVRKDWRLPQLNVVRVPEALNDASVRADLLKYYNLEIGAGLGPLQGDVWRIGLMGYSSRPENVLLCVGALESLLKTCSALATVHKTLENR